MGKIEREKGGSRKGERGGRGREKTESEEGRNERWSIGREEGKKEEEKEK